MKNKYDSNRIVEKTYQILEMYVDNFKLIKDVRTDLMYGLFDENISDIFLTIIIPTYKRNKLLKEAIQSVLNQQPVDYNWEFIVIDNTEFDDNNETPALKIVREINNKKILYYHNRVNIGSGYNWNRGVELARGKWVSFLHDDDVLCSDALLNIGRILIKHSKLDKPLGYIHARSLSFNDNFNENRVRFRYLPFEIELTKFTTLLLGHTHTGMPTCGTTILRKAYIEAGGINYDFGPTADAVLGYIIMKKYTVLRSGVVLGGYRWSLNETLKVDTIKKLLISDRLFAEYRYKQSWFAKKWGILFSTAQCYDNVFAKVNLLKKYSDGDAEVLHKNIVYPKCNIFMIILYRCIKVTCKIMIVVKGILKYSVLSY